MPPVHPPVDMSRIACIILGGGQGSRLFPLTETRCKPAVCFGGKYLIIDVPLSNAINSGVHKIFIVTQFLSASLHRHIFKTYHLHSFSTGFIEVLNAEEKPSKKVWFQGTADAVRQNVEYFIETPVDYFLILGGDQLYNLDFRNMVRTAKQTEADLVIGALPVNGTDAKRMGILGLGKSGEVTDFVEKPQDPDVLKRFHCTPEEFQARGLEASPDAQYLGSMGIYLFKREVLIDLLMQDTRDDFGKHLIPTQIEKGGVHPFLHNSYWEDIGTIASFYHANMQLVQNNPKFDCYNEGFPIFTSRYNLPAPKINCAHVENSIICEGARIAAKEVSSSIVGPRSVISRGCRIRNSYLMGNDYYEPPIINSDRLPKKLIIEEDCIIDKAIIDKNVHLGKGVTLVNEKGLDHYDSDKLFVRDGVIIVTRGTHLPDGFTF